MRGKKTIDMRQILELNERLLFLMLILIEFVLIHELFDLYKSHALAFFTHLCFAMLFFGIAKQIEDARCIISFSYDFTHIAFYNLLFKSLLAFLYFSDLEIAKDIFNHTKYAINPVNSILFFLFVFRFCWFARCNGRFVVWPPFGLQDILSRYFPRKDDVEQPTGWITVAGYVCMASAGSIGYYVSQIQGRKSMFVYITLFAMMILVPWLAKSKSASVDTSEGMTRAEQQAAAEAALRVLAERNAKAAHNVAEVAAATVMRAELDLTKGYDHYHAVLMATAETTLKAEQAQAAAEMARADAVAAVAAAEATAAAAVVAKAAAERAMQELAEQNRLIEAELNLSTRVDDDERKVLVMYRKLPYMERLKWTTAIKFSVQHLEFAYTREERIRKREAGLSPD